MLKFRPITYADADLRAYKYTGTSSILEGTFCTPAASSSQHVAGCTLFTATATIPLGTGPGTVSLALSGRVFPVYREEPDIENVGATIVQNQYVIGMLLRPGSEFEVHSSVIGAGALASFGSAGQVVAVSTVGQVTIVGAGNDTQTYIGEVVATLNATWLRVRAF